MTTSLFGTTLLVSFLVVGMPHIFPCPAPRTQFADYEITEDGKQRRRRRPSSKGSETENDVPQHHAVTQEQVMTETEQEALRKKAHECPVPKPGGRIGEMLGFPKKDEQVSRPPKILVERRASGG
ncbi:MAG: hypothetical protein L6R38_009301 [Xanthoria sp. 2 TBL-2021]|nr:MAG: hypothetical protein L6R38_009301 [Xanthoria sp. 2 TBL-2021]